MLAYENEAIFAQQNGQDIDYMVPDATSYRDPVAVTKTPRTPAGPGLPRLPAAPSAQKIFADNGYRPVVAA